MEKLQEILIITQEECAEVVQAISKCFRFGDLNTNPKLPSSIETNRDRVEKEIGDMLAMVDCLIEIGFLNAGNLELAKYAKKNKLRRWSTIYGEK